MQIEILVSISGNADPRYGQPDFNYSPGQIVTVADALAEEWIASGIAETVPTNNGGSTSTLVGTASDVTGRGSSQAAVTLATAPTPGPYSVKLTAELNTPSALGNAVTFTINWTGAHGARSATIGPLNLGPAQAANGYISALVHIYVGSGDVTYSSTLTGAGTSTYDVHASLRTP